ncbi:MAG: glycosyltransferase [Firmicutes bacterium]|nr:glycosyltransferase [Bacillota bacterium]
MNILLFSDSYLPYVSGVVRSIEMMVETLSEKEVRFFLVVPAYPGTYDVERTHYRVASFAAPTAPAFRIPFFDTPGLRRWLRQIPADVVHVHSPFVTGLRGLREARRRSIPCLFTYHTRYGAYAHYVPMLGRSLSKPIDDYARAFARRVDAVVAPSRELADQLAEAGVAAVVIPTGVRAEHLQGGAGELFRRKFHLSANQAVAISVGRLAKEKHLDFVLRALAHLGPEQRPVLLLAGEGPARGPLQQLALRLGIEASVHFVGTLQGEALRDLYAAADFFVTASLTETQGLSAAEALTCGLPVVAVDAPGLRETVENGVNGLLVSNDENHFATAIATMTKDRTLRQRLADGARTSAVRWSAERSASLLLELYEQLANSTPFSHRLLFTP